jgi:hypothetical protein
VRMLTPNTPAQVAQVSDSPPFNAQCTIVQNNPAHVRVDLGRMLEHVREVRLTEYMIHNNGTAAVNNVWRISLAGSNLLDKPTCSTPGNGICVCIADMTNPYHHSYDNPRVMSIDSKRGITTLDINVTVADTGAAPTFNSITLFLTVVMDNPAWSIEDVAQNDKNKVEWWRSNLNVGRFRF